ncbi:TPA: phage tail sheath family protein [Pseudomonas aeruginosa]|nr:phage tail sheath family protein [Pseudomonas aeruginosa]
MSMQFDYPGVFTREDGAPGLAVQSGATAIPVFIGLFFPRDPAVRQAGLARQCVRVEDWLDFSSKFEIAALAVHLKAPEVPEGTGVLGINEEPEPQPHHNTRYDLEGIGHTLGSYSVRLYFENGGGPCYVLCLDKAHPEYLVPAIEVVTDITLLVYCEYITAETDQAILAALNPLLLQQPGYFLITDSTQGSALEGLEAKQTAAYYPALRTVYRLHLSQPMKPSLVMLTGYRPGVDTLQALIDEIGTIEPDPDSPFLPEPIATYQLVHDAVGFYTAKLLHGIPIILRASPAMAGVYVRTDRSRGVWKAPANTPLAAVDGLAEVVHLTSMAQVAMTDEKVAEVHAAGVNAIRHFTSTGSFIPWGARTLAGNAANSDPAWRYIPVRRLFNSVERDLQAALGQAMFEPNTPSTWEKARAAIDAHLHDLWQRGALQGQRAEDAYFVQVGLGLTMTREDIDAGRMIVQVGLAVVRPAEFIILRFTQHLEAH